MTSADIRKKFLGFFLLKGHVIVPSAPIVVKNDPTLMFTNSGMNQFKDYFLGNKKAQNARVADTQKCLRVSGKHNDLEEVGVDTYHHTMFEMLGNWSFGDYFKKEAIEWSWELLTKVYGLDEDRLYVTIFEGDEKEGLPKDDEALNEWKKWLPEQRILPFGKKDNFWEMGDTGPCGPCTEIHVDCRDEEERKAVDGKTLVNNDHPQVIEIWNNVFIQFERYWNPKYGGIKELREWEHENKKMSLDPLLKKEFGEKRKQKHLGITSLKELPSKHVDTGMGFERLVRVIQKKQSNYDTDVFTGTIKAIKEFSGQRNEQQFDQPTSKKNIACRVIADHIRAISFCIADGQLPSNTGAGYVIRRILRRAVRYYYSSLEYKEALLYKLVPLLANQFKDVFPELLQQVDFVSKVVLEEEEAFLKTLDKGLKRIGSIIDASFPRTTSIATISGKDAFELFDTFGFPLDLTTLIATENSMFVDEVGFEKEMLEQKSRSRAATAIDTEDWINFSGPEEVETNLAIKQYFEEEKEKLKYSDIDTNAEKSNIFVGYDTLACKARILRCRKVKLKGKELLQVVLNKTPFYAESGGQIGDTGWLEFGNSKVEVIDTKKENDLIVHFIESIPMNFSGDVIARVNEKRRHNIALHHSATHLLHAALRKVVGNHVAQKGSLVNDEHLRFDFSHFAKVTDEEISKVEALVNEKIRENIPVVIKQMPKEEALKLGAMALFGEKYGDIVRVVIIDPDYSVELCGGTHVGSTGELGILKITSESAVAAGVRRIEAICGKQAEGYINEQLGLLRSVRESLKNTKDIQKAIGNLLEENDELKKKLDHAENRMLVGVRNELLQKDEIINGVNFVGDIVEVGNPDALKKLCFDLKNHLRDHVAVLCANIGGKPFVAVGISDTVVVAKKLDAGKIIKEHIAPLIKGGGGGQKTLATAGGQDPGNLNKVIEKVRSLL